MCSTVRRTNQLVPRGGSAGTASEEHVTLALHTLRVVVIYVLAHARAASGVWRAADSGRAGEQASREARRDEAAAAAERAGRRERAWRGPYRALGSGSRRARAPSRRIRPPTQRRRQRARASSTSARLQMRGRIRGSARLDRLSAREVRNLVREYLLTCVCRTSVASRLGHVGRVIACSEEGE